jgi:uncharacterized protein with von Willebrand factor type A (vWA) domain
VESLRTDGSAFVSNLLLFGRVLRRAGLDVHHSRLLDCVRALDWVGVARREDVRATLAALLVHRQEDLEPFGRAFEIFFRAPGRNASDTPPFPRGERQWDSIPAPGGGAPNLQFERIDSESPTDSERVVGAYSAAAISRSKDFADFTAAELEQAHRMLAAFPWQLGSRRTRRWQRARGGAIDLRRVVRQSQSRGEVMDFQYRRKRKAPRPVIVIGDVSGSMERYSRVLLHFIYGLSRTAPHVESFLFSTTLTRISRRMVAPAAARELTRVIRDIQDWGGGTRIGEALRQFNTGWARRVMRHGPVVLLVSDGWDRGDPATLAREIARLRRSCRRLIWLNPLLGSADYEPLTRGMQAALPYVDDFLPAHNLSSLEQLAGHLRALA